MDKDKGFSSSFILDELQFTVISCHFRTQHLFTVILCVADLVLIAIVQYLCLKGDPLMYTLMHVHQMHMAVDK